MRQAQINQPGIGQRINRRVAGLEIHVISRQLMRPEVVLFQTIAQRGHPKVAVPVRQQFEHKNRTPLTGERQLLVTPCLPVQASCPVTIRTYPQVPIAVLRHTGHRSRHPIASRSKMAHRISRQIHDIQSVTVRAHPQPTVSVAIDTQHTSRTNQVSPARFIPYIFKPVVEAWLHIHTFLEHSQPNVAITILQRMLDFGFLQIGPRMVIVAWL